MDLSDRKSVAIVMMGVTGSGKTTAGLALAELRGCTFLDGDDYHPPANVDKMRRGEPLTDEDRAPWLDILRELIHKTLAAGQDVVLACSALREHYRQRLAPRDSALASRIHFVYLKINPEQSRQRLQSRAEHFMPTSLVQSQFEALEEPSSALVIDAQGAVDEIAQTIDAAFPRAS